MSIPARLIYLRFLQLYRGSGDLGLFRALLVMVVFLPMLALFLVQHISIHPWTLAIPAVVLYIIWLVHTNRRDYRFLLAVTASPRKVFLAEYFLFTLPVMVLMLWAQIYLHALVFCCLVILITFTVPSVSVTSTRTMKLPVILTGMFEWQSGIRKNMVVLVIFYLTGLFGFYHIGFSAGSLLFLSMIFVSFYSEYEPRNILLTGATNPLRFLAGKLAIHIGFFALLMSPIFFIALINNEFRWISAGYFLASINLLVFSILLKYYHYRPGAYSGSHQMLTSLACFISVILPAAAVIALLNLYLAAGAHRNLKLYMDDRN